MVDAIVLAGGLGTRLCQVVPTLPKVLAPIQGVPFLRVLLEKLNQAPFLSKIVMALGHKSEAVVAFLENELPLVGSLVDFSIETQALGTGGAVLLSLRKTSFNTLLIVNGDTFFDLDLKAFYEFHRQKKASMTLAVRYEEEAGRYGSVEIGSDQRILGFKEKSTAIKSGWVSGGMYLIEKEMFSSFTVGCAYSLERDFFPLFLNRGVFGFADTGAFIDIGTANSYKQAQEVLQPWIHL